MVPQEVLKESPRSLEMDLLKRPKLVIPHCAFSSPLLFDWQTARILVHTISSIQSKMPWKQNKIHKIIPTIWICFFNYSKLWLFSARKKKQRIHFCKGQWHFYSAACTILSHWWLSIYHYPLASHYKMYFLQKKLFFDVHNTMNNVC